MDERDFTHTDELIVKFMGYVYTYDVSSDFSDCGGLYSDMKVYSKVPLRIEYEDILLEDKRKFRDDYILVQKGGWHSGYPDSLMYRKSWDALMPVKFAIEQLNDDRINVEEFILGKHSSIKAMPIPYTRNSTFIAFELVTEGEHSTLIEATYECIVQFINWYNEITSKTL
jgi:hypothetical protein